MARSTLNLKVLLENIHCYDEGDGWGNAEPYLWPIFFKIDGDSYSVEAGAGLIGFPTIESRNGHHGNLGNTDVDAGDDVAVPDALGIWQNTLKPIPINDPVIKSLIGDDLPGIAGVAVVLMEQDSWPDSLADTGYNALISSVQLAVAKVAAGFQHATHAPTKAEIDAAIQTVKTTAASMVHDAVKGTMSGWQLIWFGTFGNNDDTIGSEVWTFNHDDFANDAVIEFSRRWSGDESGDGDWDISGSFTGVVPCPANALSQFLGNTNTQKAGGIQGRTSSPRTSSSRTSSALAAMHEFQATRYQALPGLEFWWRALQAGTPDLIRIAARTPHVRTALERVFAALPAILASPDQSLPPEHLRDLATILTEVSETSPLLHRAFARRALAVLPELQGQTWNEAIHRIAHTLPLGRNRHEKTKVSRSETVSASGDFGVLSHGRKATSVNHKPTAPMMKSSPVEPKQQEKKQVRFRSDNPQGD